MSTPQAPVSPQSGPRFGLSRRTWLIAAAAFGIGLLLFLLLWLDQRTKNDFYRPESEPKSTTGQVFEPLPAPLPAGEASDAASGMREEDAEAAQEARIIERPPAPVAPPPPPSAPAAPAPSTRPAPGNTPVAIAKTEPKYPPEAFRNGESGSVVVRVEVSAEGAPTSVEVARSSRSRALDRAALQAVRKWRFRPSQRNGQPVPGATEVEINFRLE